MSALALTLLVALAAALVLGALAHRAGLPPMLGYIAAGLVVGPATPGVIVAREEVLALADVGVALLMFSIGLQFSPSELRRAGTWMLVATPMQVLATMAVGTGAGLIMGWDPMEALFIGGAVSVCSTVVLVKVAGEELLQTTAYGRVALAVSIVQDLVTVALVVILSALGSRGEASIERLVVNIGVAIGFVALVVVAGSRVLPQSLVAIARLRSRELFIIAVAVLSIGLAFTASLLGVSVALGAFVAGLALADSDLTASVLGEIVPLRELFATFFFVSIGMLLDPEAILAAWPAVLALLLIVTLGKAIPVTILGWAGGERPGAAVRAGALIGQSGEFSFVLASTGLALGAVRPDTFSMAMGAVVASMVTAGPLLGAGQRLGDWLERRASPPPLPGEDPVTARRHAVILGYGRAGKTVARILGARGFAWVAVDSNYHLALEAREADAPLVYGEAGQPAVLDRAGIATAHALVVTIPDALAARQAIGYALERNPRIEIVSRAGSEADADALRRLGAARAVVAERELENELVRHALRRFGVSDREVAAFLASRRSS